MESKQEKQKAEHNGEDSFEEEEQGEELADDEIYELDGNLEDNEEFRELEDQEGNDADDWVSNFGDESGVFNSDADTFNNSKAVFEKPACVIKVFEGHTQGVLSLSLNPKNGNELVSGGLDDRLSIWSLTRPEPICVKAFPDSVALVEFGFDGKLIAAACLDNSIKIFENNPDTGFSEKYELKGITEEITVR
jgi:WD40 repeat protein